MSRFITIKTETYEKELIVNVDAITKVTDYCDRRVFLNDGSDYALSYQSWKELMSIISNKEQSNA